MTQADWVKEYLQHAFARHIQHGMDDIKKNPKWKLNNECTNWAIGELDEAMEVVNKAITLAQQRTEKKWRSKVEEQITYLTNKHGLLSSVLYDLKY